MENPVNDRLTTATRGQFPFPSLAFTCLVTGLLTGLLAAPLQAQADYDRSSAGTRILEGGGGLAIKILVEQSNLGSGEVEVGEITFPAGSQGGSHNHEAIEIFYVLSGRMKHVVNGEGHVIEPGMVAIVRPGDSVSHEVLDGKPVKALVIWAPGGEAERLAQFFTAKPIE